MIKKTAHKKKSLKNVDENKKNSASGSVKTISYFLKRYFISLFIVTMICLCVQHFSQSSPHFCANSISCTHDLSLRVENNTVGTFEGHKVMPPKIELSPIAVLGAQTTTGTKHIYVDLASQTLYALKGTSIIFQTLISSGKWHPTPIGNFKIWVKLQSTRMSGGEGDDAYDLPNVPYTMFFSNDEVPASEGFSIHGAYWHNNFGHPMSHGCINMRPDDAKRVYDWADPATTGSTTYVKAKNPGTEVSICTNIEKKTGKFVCVQ